LVTDQTGNIIETIDYYPYGAPRFDEKAGNFNENRKYIGEYYDSTSKLSYLNARYYNGNTGRFISEDPVFLSTKQDLANPQSLNSYAYANNNPVNAKDPSGLYSLDDMQKQITELTAKVFALQVQVANFLILNDLKTITNADSTPAMRTWAVVSVGSNFVGGGEAKTGVAGIRAFGEKVVEGSAFVCRGGGCSAEKFISGATKIVDGKLYGVSVNSSANLTKEELGKSLGRYSQVGFTTIEDILKIGGSIEQTGNGLHHVVGGLTPEQFVELFGPAFKNPGI